MFVLGVRFRNAKQDRQLHNTHQKQRGGVGKLDELAINIKACWGFFFGLASENYFKRK
jgi:hypothetical protein